MHHRQAHTVRSIASKSFVTVRREGVSRTQPLSPPLVPSTVSILSAPCAPFPLRTRREQRPSSARSRTNSREWRLLLLSLSLYLSLSSLVLAQSIFPSPPLRSVTSTGKAFGTRCCRCVSLSSVLPCLNSSLFQLGEERVDPPPPTPFSSLNRISFLPSSSAVRETTSGEISCRSDHHKSFSFSPSLFLYFLLSLFRSSSLRNFPALYKCLYVYIYILLPCLPCSVVLPTLFIFLYKTFHLNSIIHPSFLSFFFSFSLDPLHNISELLLFLNAPVLLAN